MTFAATLTAMSGSSMVPFKQKSYQAMLNLNRMSFARIQIGIITMNAEQAEEHPILTSLRQAERVAR